MGLHIHICDDMQTAQTKIPRMMTQAVLTTRDESERSSWLDVNSSLTRTFVLESSAVSISQVREKARE